MYIVPHKSYFYFFIKFSLFFFCTFFAFEKNLEYCCTHLLHSFMLSGELPYKLRWQLYLLCCGFVCENIIRKSFKYQFECVNTSMWQASKWYMNGMIVQEHWKPQWSYMEWHYLSSSLHFLLHIGCNPMQMKIYQIQNSPILVKKRIIFNSRLSFTDRINIF